MAAETALGVAEMKLIQLNMWMGHLMHPALAFIDEQAPDILCAQEILQSDTAHPLFDYFQLHERLCERFAYQYFSPTLSFWSSGVTVQLGNAMYSRLPLTNTATAFTSKQYTPDQTADTYVRNIRNIQRAQLELPDGRRLTIANHHGFHDVDPLGNEQTVEAMHKAAQFLGEVSGPLVFCGDLNVLPESPALRELDDLGLRNLTAEHGIATTLSTATRVKRDVACDYIFINDEIKLEKFHAGEVVVSDHKPLILEFAV